MENIKTYENFLNDVKFIKVEKTEIVNESISDILFISAIIFGSLFGISLIGASIILTKSKRIRSIFKEMLLNIPELFRMRNKIKKSDNFKNLMKLAKDFSLNPTYEKKSKIMSGLKDILNEGEIKQIQDTIFKSLKKLNNEE